jgi:NAD(P)-dependent dehydrogenase (short-subunit alcohol dehydrogenase family)
VTNVKPLPGTGVLIGAAGTIGGSCLRALSGSATSYVLADLHADALAAAVAAVPGASHVQADLSHPGGPASIAAAVRKMRMPVAWLVMAAGTPQRGAFDQTPADRLDHVFRVNCLGPLHVIRELLGAEWLPDASIVVIGSVSATRALPGRVAYGASKAALEQACRSLAAELAPRRVRVNVVAPGVVDSPFLGSSADDLKAWVADHVPAARLGRPEEIAEVVRYLTLSAPPYLTGSRVAVDGGMEARA